jgi:pimeloyl-ACP methyl ester carboxylesterase
MHSQSRLRAYGSTALTTLFAALTLIASALVNSQPNTSQTIDIGHATLNLVIWETQDPAAEIILALPGSGGDSSRYRLLGPLLAQAGYRTIAINQRGIMGSTGELEGLTLYDYASDVIAVADALGVARFHLVGWALGNRTARAANVRYPDRIASLSLIAAGGLAKPLTEPGELGQLLGNSTLTTQEKIHLAKRSLFSSASGDEMVREYAQSLKYWPDARASQSAANRATPLDQWWSGGTGPMLIVQGLDDKTAPPENGFRMKTEFGDRIILVNLADAGHLMGLERPIETANALLEHIRRYPIEK